MLSERSQSPKATRYLISCMWNIQNRQIHKNKQKKSRLVAAWGGGRGSGEWQLRAAGILLGVRKIFWNWHTMLNKLKAIRLYTWKGWIEYYLNSISRKLLRGFGAGSVVKNLPANAGDLGSVPALGRHPGEGNSNPTATHCSILVWRSPWNSNPLQYSCLEKSMEQQPTAVFLSGKSMDRGPWQATVHGVIKVEYNLATKQQQLKMKLRKTTEFVFTSTANEPFFWKIQSFVKAMVIPTISYSLFYWPGSHFISCNCFPVKILRDALFLLFSESTTNST